MPVPLTTKADHGNSGTTMTSTGISATHTSRTMAARLRGPMSVPRMLTSLSASSYCYCGCSARCPGPIGSPMEHRIWAGLKYQLEGDASAHHA